MATDSSRCDIGYYQEKACEDSEWAYYFALDIDDANISYCQKSACKEPDWAYWFLEDIPEANIEYCYNNSLIWKDKILKFILEDL